MTRTFFNRGWPGPAGRVAAGHKKLGPGQAQAEERTVAPGTLHARLLVALPRHPARRALWALWAGLPPHCLTRNLKPETLTRISHE